MSQYKYLIGAAKAGAWAEFLGERAYRKWGEPYIRTKAMPYAQRIYRRVYRRARARLGLNSRRRRLAVKRAYPSMPKPSAKRARFSKKNIGEQVGSSNCKRVVTYVRDNLAQSTRILYSDTITDVPAATTGNPINQRQRDIINCRGFKIRLTFRNITAMQMTYHIAVISPKSLQNNVNPTGFFRGDDNDRDLDFSTARSYLDFTHKHINTDKYNILFHKKYLVQAGNANAASGSCAGSSPCYRQIQKWVPLKRQLRYNDTVGASCESPIYIVRWCDRMDANTNDLPSEAYIENVQVTMYFRETKT